MDYIGQFQIKHNRKDMNTPSEWVMTVRSLIQPEALYVNEHSYNISPKLLLSIFLTKMKRMLLSLQTMPLTMSLLFVRKVLKIPKGNQRCRSKVVKQCNSPTKDKQDTQ